MNDAYLRWPRTDDPLDNVWAQTAVPMLMLQGQLDPACPYDFSVELTQHFAGPRQTYVAFPYGAHNVFVGTPVASGPPPLHCADRIFSAFLTDPEAELDTSCRAETLPLDFEGTHWAPRPFLLDLMIRSNGDMDYPLRQDTAPIVSRKEWRARRAFVASDRHFCLPRYTC